MAVAQGDEPARRDARAVGEVVRERGRRGKTIKKDVKEYWLADPICLMKGGKYVFAATLTEEDTLQSATVPCLAVDLGTVFPPEETV